jgi:WD40 repeat protein
MNYHFVRQILTLAGLITLLAGLQFSGLSRTHWAYPSIDPTHAPKLVVQTGHNDSPSAFAFSADGDLLASGSLDHTIILWQVSTGRQLRSFKGHSDSVDDVAFSHDGRMLASVSNGSGRRINLWNVRNGALLKDITLESDVHEIAFAAADSFLVGLNKEDFGNDAGDTYKPFMGRIGSVRIWEAHTLAEVYIGNLRADKFACSPVEPVLAIAEKFIPKFEHYQVSYNPDQWQLPANKSSDFSPSIQLIDLKSGKVIHTLKGHAARIRALAFSNDGKAVVSSGEDGMIKVWDRVRGRLLSSTPVKPKATYSVQFGDDNSKIVGVRSDGAVLAIDTKLKRSQVIVKIEGWASLGPGVRSIAVGREDSVELWQPGRKRPAWAVALKREGATATTLDAARMILAVSKSTGNIDVWRPYKSRQPIRLNAAQSVRAMIFNAQGELIVDSLDTGKITKWNARWAAEPREYKCEDGRPIRIDAQGRLLSLAPFPDLKSDVLARPLAPAKWGNPLIQIRDMHTCHEIKMPAAEVGPDSKAIDNHAAISRRGILAVAGPSYDIPLMAFGGPPDAYRWFPYQITEIKYPLRLINLIDGKVLDTLVGKTYGLAGPVQISPGSVNTLAFNNSGSLLAAGGGYQSWGGHIDVWDVSKRELKTRLEQHYEVRSVAFNPQNERELLSVGFGPDISVWNVDDREARLLQGHTDAVTSVAFSNDGRLIISSSEDNTTKLWAAADGKELATIVSVGEGEWVVTSPQGLFDTNRIEGGSLVNWVMDDDPLHALSVDIFTRDYFEPDLLRRVIRSALKNEPLRTVRPLAGINRVQPLVRIVDVKPETGQSDEVSVTVEVTNPSVSYSKGEKVEADYAAFDLRLFRAGKLVATYPQANSDIKQGAADGGLDELAAWRAVKKFRLDSRSGKFRHVFHDIHRPRCGESNHVEFTAYAFNSDRVRSETSVPYRYNLSAAVVAACRRAYVITVGVGANQSDWNLAFAAKSAEDVHSALTGKFVGKYDLVDIQLLSKFDTDGPRVALKQATKQNLRTVLDILAGRAVSEEQRWRIPKGELLRKATPDDLVVLYLSSHGYADPSGNFYIIPYDSGPAAGVSEVTLNECFAHRFQPLQCQAERAFLRRSISADDFAAWWENVDGGEMVMILDSCYSASAPGRGFRPGPLGDRGFGQLAYDKGMLLLTAAQPDRPAIASLRLGSGRSLLGDALIGCLNENLNQPLSQCLRQAETRVAEQYKALYPNSNDDDVQSPTLLDFTLKR